MAEAIWRTYSGDEIKEEYMGKDTLLILKLGPEGERSSIHNLKGGYRELGGLVIVGNSGAVFSGVDYTKLTTSKNGSEMYFEEGNNPRIGFNDCVLTLERLLLKKQEVATQRQKQKVATQRLIRPYGS